MKWLRRLSKPASGLLILAMLFVLWQVWVFVQPRPKPYTPAELAAIAGAGGQVRFFIETALPHRAAGTNGPVRFGVAHLSNDPTDMVTHAVKAALAGHEGWQVEQSSPIQKFLADVSATVMRATSWDEITHAGRRVELDVVVAGSVESVTARDDGAAAVLQVYAYDVRTGRWLIHGPVQAMWKPPAPGLLERLGRTKPLTRFVSWIAFVAVLPWLTGFATRAIAERKSNALSAALLVGYTAADLVAGLVLSGFRVVGASASVRMLLALVFCAAYNFWTAERIAERARER